MALLLSAPPSADPEGVRLRFLAGAAWDGGGRPLLRWNGVARGVLQAAPASWEPGWVLASWGRRGSLLLRPGSRIAVSGASIRLDRGELRLASADLSTEVRAGGVDMLVCGGVRVALGPPVAVFVLDGHIHHWGRRYEAGMALRGGGPSPRLRQRPWPRGPVGLAPRTAGRRAAAPSLAELRFLACDRGAPSAMREAALDGLGALGAAEWLASLGATRLEEPLERVRLSHLVRLADPGALAEVRRRAGAMPAALRLPLLEGCQSGEHGESLAVLLREPASGPAFRLEAALLSGDVGEAIRETDRFASGFVRRSAPRILAHPPGAGRALLVAACAEMAGLDALLPVLRELSVGETVLLADLLQVEADRAAPEAAAEVERLLMLAGLSPREAAPLLLGERQAAEFLRQFPASDGVAPGAPGERRLWLAHPFADGVDPILTSLARRGWSRFDLEASLDGERAFVPLPPLEAAAPGHAVRDAGGAAFPVRRATGQWLAMRDRLTGAILDALDRADRPALPLESVRPDWRLLRAIAGGLAALPDVRVREIEPVLYRWMGSGPSEMDIELLGRSRAWMQHMDSLLPAFQDPGEGFFFDDGC